MPSDSAARMLAARPEIIERLHKSREFHGLDDAQIVAVGVHAIAAALIELSGVTGHQQAGEAIQASVRRYLADMDGSIL